MQLLYMFPCNDADSSWSSWNNMKLPVPLCDSRMSSNLHVSTSFPFLTTWSLLPSDHQSSFSFIFPTVVFSSMTSLQKEEFFDLVATSQARRLDDQRAQLERSPPAKSKARSFRGSIKQLSFVRRPTATPASVPVPVPVPKEDLYNMILTTQVSKWVDVFLSRYKYTVTADNIISMLKHQSIISGSHFSHLSSTHRPRVGWRTSAAGLQVPWTMRTSSPCFWGSKGDAWTSRGLNYHACCKPEKGKKT